MTCLSISAVDLPQASSLPSSLPHVGQRPRRSKSLIRSSLEDPSIVAPTEPCRNTWKLSILLMYPGRHRSDSSIPFDLCHLLRIVTESRITASRRDRVVPASPAIVDWAVVTAVAH